MAAERNTKNAAWGGIQISQGWRIWVKEEFLLAYMADVMICVFLLISCIQNGIVMRTDEILKEIKRLPVHQRIFIIEKAIASIREHEEREQMSNAVEELYSDYRNDKELTAFINIDFEDFYEA